MSHTDKLAAAQALLEEFNKSAPEGKSLHVDKIIQKIQEAGGVSEEVLREATWEDIEGCGVPRLLAKRVATIFRQASDVAPKSSYISEKHANRLSPTELIAAYDTNDVDSATANELHKRSEGKKFLFIEEDGKVNVNASVQELLALRKGHTERDVARNDNKTYTLRRVKDRQPELADENPIYKGRALRPDGSCDQTNRSWDRVSTTVRQLVYIAIYDVGEAKVNNLDAANDLIDRAISVTAEDMLRSRYVRASARFDELKKLGELPKLRIIFGGSSKKVNDPFFSGR